MKTLKGDGSGAVIELGVTVSEPNRCEYEDEHGRCKNDKDGNDIFCAWHRELIMLRFRASNEMNNP